MGKKTIQDMIKFSAGLQQRKKNAVQTDPEGSWIYECAWKFQKNILEICNIQLIISNGIEKQSSKIVIK